MAIGERIRFLRNLHGATQKWLGLKLGFSEKTAETRVGQYEIGARTPKDEMIKDIAEIFGVSPQAIKLPDLDNYNAVLHTLFAILSYDIRSFLECYDVRKVSSDLHTADSQGKSCGLAVVISEHSRVFR